MSIPDVLAGRAQWVVHEAHVLSGLRLLPDESIHCAITSIPYWGLRSYGTEPQVWGGDKDCPHDWQDKRRPWDNRRAAALAQGLETAIEPRGMTTPDRSAAYSTCHLCGAWRGELGLEPDPALFIEHIVEIFQEVKRVLRRDGNLWLNIGDSYAGSWGNYGSREGRQRLSSTEHFKRPAYEEHKSRPPTSLPGLMPKSLMMMPARVAIAMQDDGWLLRSEITWCKRAPMPESCTDRPTSATEKIYLFAKQGRYWYDADAVRERGLTAQTRPDHITRNLDGSANEAVRTDRNYPGANDRQRSTGFTRSDDPAGRNMWNYLTLPADRWRLRADLTPEQRRYVLQRMLDAGYPGSDDNSMNSNGHPDV